MRFGPTLAAATRASLRTIALATAVTAITTATDAAIASAPQRDM